MPRAMADEVSNVIIGALARGLSRGQISGVVGISKKAIARIQSNLLKYGTPRPPPKGLKLGRPARVTRAQAEAMLAWMAERNQVFFVKDLAKYLRENHKYKGSYASVRRCLTRAGFKRKLPWHRSEITTWLAPDHPPIWQIVREEGDVRGDAESESEDEDEDDIQQQQKIDLDPALQDHASSALLDLEEHDPSNVLNASMAQTTCPHIGLPKETSLQISSPSAPPSHQVPEGTHSPVSVAAPSRSSASQGLYHVLSSIQHPIKHPSPYQSPNHNSPPHQSEAQHRAPLPSALPRPTPHLIKSKRKSKETSAKENPPSSEQPARRGRGRPKSQPKPPPAPPSPKTLATQVTTLQSEVARQQDMILKLTQQLAQQQQRPSQQRHLPLPSIPEDFRSQLLVAAELADDAIGNAEGAQGYSSPYTAAP